PARSPCQPRMSSSFLSSLFCCCGKLDERSDDDIPDENTRLIPHSIEVSPSPPAGPTIDHQRRLIEIVRAKERKMVNVASIIPFNLHNRAITPTASLSRSTSLSARRNENSLTASNEGREPLTVTLRGPPSPLNASTPPRNASSSQSRSESASGLPADLGIATPILNVRLVPTSQPAQAERIGRPRHRAFGSPVSSESTNDVAGALLAGAPSSLGSERMPTSESAAISEPLNEICLSWEDGD
ncbi:unnamed protein product, partial [Mycena citricolor]